MDERSRGEVELRAPAVLSPQAKGWQGIGMRQEVSKRCEPDEGKSVSEPGPKAKNDPVNF